MKRQLSGYVKSRQLKVHRGHGLRRAMIWLAGGSCVAAFFAVAVLMAQQPQTTTAPADPSKTGRIEGQVISPKGEPVRGAEVRVVPLRLDMQPTGGATFGALSDDNGKFLINGIAPNARLQLQADKNGYSQARYGATSITAPTATIALKEGEQLGPYVLTMVPQGVMTGRVTDANGDPLPKVPVLVMRKVFLNGVRVIGQPQGSGLRTVQTDDQGEFRVPGMLPGVYYLMAASNTDFGNGLIGVPTYFPGVKDPKDAQAIDLTAGGDRAHLDIRLVQDRGYTLRGRVVGYTASAPAASVRNGAAPAAVEARVRESLTAAGGRAALSSQPRVEAILEGVMNGTLSTAGQRSHQTSVDRDGNFELRTVTPGDYVLRSTVPGPDNQPLIASQRVKVTSDVSGLQLTPSPGLTITGKISVEDGTLQDVFDGAALVAKGGGRGRGKNLVNASGAANGMVVTMSSVSDAAADTLRAIVKEDGTFTFEGLAAGRYTLDRMITPGVYVKAIKWGGVDVMRTGLDIAQSGTLEMVFTKGAVQLTGAVKNLQGVPTPGVTVVLWPEAWPKAFEWSGARASNSDTQGAFSAVAMTPGVYYVAALESTNGNIGMLPDMFAQLKAKALRVEVQDGVKPVDAPFIPADQVQAAIDRIP